MLSQDEQWLLDEKYSGEKTAGFFADCKRLQAGEPLAYVIGFVPFLGCKIWLDSRPLIPRPETEFWVEKAIDNVQQEQNSTHPLPSRPSQTLPSKVTTSLSPAPVVRVLDLCAGSGAIGVAVAKAVPMVRVDFGEIDARLLPTITKNLAENSIDPNRCQLIASDLFTDITDTYDFILSNPPYIDPAFDRTQNSVKNFEPHLALYGGQGGFDIIEKIITEAPKHLTKGGELWIEHEPEQSEAIQETARANGFSCTVHQDQFNTDRYSVLVKM